MVSRSHLICHLTLAAADVLQLYMDKPRMEEAQPGSWDILKGSIDVGDFIGVSGGVKRTERGELSVVASSLQVGTSHWALPEPQPQGLSSTGQLSTSIS